SLALRGGSDIVVPVIEEPHHGPDGHGIFPIQLDDYRRLVSLSPRRLASTSPSHTQSSQEGPLLAYLGWPIQHALEIRREGTYDALVNMVDVLLASDGEVGIL